MKPEDKEISTMKIVKDEEQTPKEEKLTYEQLEQVAKEASRQANYFLAELNKRNDDQLLRRLDYLLAIVANGDKFPADFVATCVAEIQLIMTIPNKSQE